MKLFQNLLNKKQTGPRIIQSPVSGRVMDIKEVKDAMFASEALGKGAGIQADSTKIIAPISGTISTFFPTAHAIGITSKDGVELLLHVGVDTVDLNGEHFTPFKKQGDKIQQGDLLLEVDFKSIEEKGYDSTVMMVVTNSNNFKSIKVNTGYVEGSQPVMEIQ